MTDDPFAAKRAATSAAEALDDLRTQVRSLLGMVDTGRKPDPAGVIPPGGRNPGPVWKPAPKWKIRSVDEETPPATPCVYITTPLDWDGDYESMNVDEARRLAMSILAACDWAENGAPEKKRYRVLDEDDRRSTGTFICGPR